MACRGFRRSLRPHCNAGVSGLTDNVTVDMQSDGSPGRTTSVRYPASQGSASRVGAPADLRVARPFSASNDGVQRADNFEYGRALEIAWSEASVVRYGGETDPHLGRARGDIPPPQKRVPAGCSK